MTRYKMNFLQALKKLKNSTCYKSWKEKNSDCYLTHGFFMEEKNSLPEWQIGFYNTKKDLVETFIINQKITVCVRVQNIKNRICT